MRTNKISKHSNFFQHLIKNVLMGRDKEEYQILTTAYPEPFPQESSEHDKQVFLPLQ